MYANIYFSLQILWWLRNCVSSTYGTTMANDLNIFIVFHFKNVKRKATNCRKVAAIRDSFSGSAH